MSLGERLQKWLEKKPPKYTKREIIPIEISIDKVFTSDTVVPLTEESIILDTSDPLTIAKYKNNIKLLMEETKRNQKIGKYMLIRDDDFLPRNWQWIVNSENTQVELRPTKISQCIREALVNIHLRPKMPKRIYANIPPMVSSEVETQAYQELGNTGFISVPAVFRSTKHFTVNVPLAYTGSYNLVDCNRNFTILDTSDNFFASGYAYSFSEMDAYLDITHESLPISESAIVLIEESKYKELIKDEEIKSQLKGRKVVIYRGEETLAINMVLSENGVLPVRPGLSIEYNKALLILLIEVLKVLRKHITYLIN